MRRVSAAEQNNPLQPFVPRYGLRAGIEGTISEGLRGHAMRRARYRGQPKTLLQAIAIAAAITFRHVPFDVNELARIVRAGGRPYAEEAISIYRREH